LKQRASEIYVSGALGDLATERTEASRLDRSVCPR